MTCVDNNGDGVDDNTGRACGSTAGPLGETKCGLQIISGVPIKYGELNPGQLSTEQKVTIKNVGNTPAKVIVKGGNWISDAEGNPTISGPEITHVDTGTGNEYSYKKGLTNSALEYVGLTGGAETKFYFEFKVPSSGVNGSVHQDVTIDLLC